KTALLSRAGRGTYAQTLSGSGKKSSRRFHLIVFVIVALGLLGGSFASAVSILFLSSPPAHRQVQVAASSLDYYVCGSEAQFPGPEMENPWTAVTANEPVRTPEGNTIRAVGYQGPAGAPGSRNTCSGSYHYAWDQYHHVAAWGVSLTN